MPRLPAIIDFCETDYPALTAIFDDIDAGIAAIIAGDPAFRPKPAHKRRPARATKTGTTARRIRRKQQAAA
jgi:hypothetical protein